MISGQGITLKHSEDCVDHLDKLLSFSTFDGACKTKAKLNDGVITDFNLMHDPQKYHATVETYLHKQSINLQNFELCFIYSLANDVTLNSADGIIDISLNAGDLLKITSKVELDNLSVSGEKLIIIYLSSLA